MMHHVDGGIYLLVDIKVVPKITIFLVPIVRKEHAPLHVRERSARHALLCHPNPIERLAGAPAVINQWQTLNCTDKLTAKEACNVMGGDIYFIKWIVMIQFECLLHNDLDHVAVHPCSHKLVESVALEAVSDFERWEQPIKNKMEPDCLVFILHLLQIVLLSFNAKVLRLSGERHWVNACVCVFPASGYAWVTVSA
jgi:hypothetical protein